MSMSLYFHTDTEDKVKFAVSDIETSESGHEYRAFDIRTKFGDFTLFATEEQLVSMTLELEKKLFGRTIDEVEEKVDSLETQVEELEELNESYAEVAAEQERFVGVRML